MLEAAHGSRLTRVFKTGSALGAGQLLSILLQLVLPPTFLHSYGVRGYGEWLALSSGVNWLTSLDFGLQTFIGNQLSLEFFAGRLERFRQMQSVALRITLCIVASGTALAALAVAVIPLNKVLGLSMSRNAAATIAFFLAVQILTAIVTGQLNGTLRAVGFPHRAEAWGQIRLGLSFAVTWMLAISAKPLWVIPIAQTTTYFVTTVCSLWDLRRRMPQAFPTLSYWDRDTARQVLKPSLWFGSFTLNQFLLFESPILILNQVAGKPAVVIFSLCRTYFGMIRQPSNVIRFALRPEITRLAAVEDWGVVERAYRLLVSLCFSAALISTPLAVLAAPALLPFWTKRTDVFDARLYAAMAVATLLIIAKDCRLDLQYATNRHVRSAAICLFTYAAYSVLGIPGAMLGGPVLLVLLWAAAEAIQLVLVHAENRRLLPNMTLRDVLALVVFGSGASVAAAFGGTFLRHGGARQSVLWFAASIAILLIVSLAVFNLSETVQLLRRRFFVRDAAATPVPVAGDAA